jgi:predicted Fe-Mo cluster-binding NifX family protein
MKTAIALKEGTINSPVDKHFGKCAFFLIYNADNGESEIIENPASVQPGCKAETIVKKLSDKKVSRVIAGDFGTTAQQLLNKLKVQMIIHPDTNVPASDLIALLSQ